MARRNKLVGHILDERLSEIGIAKGNTFDRELLSGSILTVWGYD